MADTVAVLLANGFEETEAAGTIDILRRAECDVRLVSIDDGQDVQGANKVTVKADGGISDIRSEALSAVVMPGGMPGSRYLAENESVLELLNSVYTQGGYVAAICAAPLALHAAGLIDGATITAYPAVSEQLTGCTVTGNAVEQDGCIITGRGPGAVFAFALRIVTVLCGEATAAEIREGMRIPLDAAR